jgi:peptidyl-dipeptidase Dcp
VLAVYAKHAGTGEVIPQALVDKLRAASTHNQGFKTTEYIAASLLDLSWHKLSPNEAAAVEDATQFEDQMMAAYGKPQAIESRYRSPYFAHILPAAIQGYYAYLWSEISTRTVSRPSGNRRYLQPRTGAAPEGKRLPGRRPARCRCAVPEFRGKDPSIEPLLEIRGLD